MKETVQEFLARGGNIEVLPSTRVRGFDKKSMQSPNIIARDWDQKTDGSTCDIDDMYKCGFFKSGYSK